MGYAIRKYKPADREQIRTICHLTATDPAYVENKELVATLYADYYTDFEPENIFVVAREEDDLAVGYILCAENYKSYIKDFGKSVLPKVREIDKGQALVHRLNFMQERYLGRKYPAHLHIDILPEAQRQGFGTQLVDALVAHLREKGVKGVHLGVGGTNEKGINFYKKYGFKLVLDFGKAGKVFGLIISSQNAK